VTPEDFVRILKVSRDRVVASAVETLRQPPGRSPHEASLRASHWFNDVPERDQAFVAWCISLGAYSAIFSLLATLDRVSFVDPSPHEELRLVHVSADGQETLLNDFQGEELHALWTNEVFPFADELPER
jgi:hypothetical protein